MKLKELSFIAESLGLSLLPGEKITLISRDRYGQVKSTHRFSRDEEGMEELEDHLCQIAAERHQEWQSEYELVIASMSGLPRDLEVTFDTFHVVVQAEDPGNGFYIFSYSREGLDDFIGHITDFMLWDEEIDDVCGNCPQTSGCKSCPHHDHSYRHHCDCGCDDNEEICHRTDCPDDRCDRNPNIVLLLWNAMDPEDQEEFVIGLPPGARKKLHNALN